MEVLKEDWMLLLAKLAIWSISLFSSNFPPFFALIKFRCDIYVPSKGLLKRVNHSFAIYRQSKRHYTTRTRQIFNVKSAKNIAISALTQHFSSSSSFAKFCQFLVRLVAIRLFFIHYLYRMLPKMLLLQFSRFRKSLAAHLFPSNKCLPFLHWRNCPSRQFQIGSIKKPHNGPKATTSVPKTSFLCWKWQGSQSDSENENVWLSETGLCVFWERPESMSISSLPFGRPPPLPLQWCFHDIKLSPPCITWFFYYHKIKTKFSKFLHSKFCI